MNKFFKVIDRCGQTIRTFTSWKAAHEFRIVNGRYDWRIIRDWRTIDTDWRTIEANTTANDFVRKFGYK